MVTLTLRAWRSSPFTRRSLGPGSAILVQGLVVEAEGGGVSKAGGGDGG